MQRCTLNFNSAIYSCVNKFSVQGASLQAVQSVRQDGATPWRKLIDATIVLQTL